MRFAGSAGIAEAEVNRCRDVLDYRRSGDVVSVLAGMSSGTRFVTRTYLQ